MNIILFQIFVAFILGLAVEIRKGRCNDTPYDICKQNGKLGVKATSLNLNELVSMLKENCIKNAYVYGWNDHEKVMVLWDNGTLVPYHVPTNSVSEYAFCAIDCPCPRDNVVYSSISYQPKYDCHPKSNVPNYNTSECCEAPPKHHYQPRPFPPYENYCPQPIPCPPYENYCPQPRPCSPPKHHYNPKPCPPRDNQWCEPSSFSFCSSSSSSEENNCPTFVKQCQKSFQNRKFRSGKPFAGSEIISCLKNYSFEYVRGSSYTLNLFEQNNVAKHEKFHINEKKTDCKKLPIPNILCCPSILLKIISYLECKYRCTVCLYIDDESKIYALIDSILYYVKVHKKHHKFDIKTKKVSKHDVNNLIKKGLYGVSFN